MLSTKFKFICFAVIVCAAAAILFVYPGMRGSTASPSVDDLQTQLEAVKTEIASKGETPALKTRYTQLDQILSKCGVVNRVTEPTIKAPFAPAASLCINGALAAADPTFARPSTQSTLPGFTASCVTTTIYDAYSFNLSGCAAFPTEVTITLCGPAGCLPPANLDTTLWLYRNVAAGDPLTANGGLPAVFNAAAGCTNIRAGQDSLNGGVSSNPGGATCNQVNTSNCLGACTGTTAVSGMRRQLGSGRFTVVVAGSQPTDIGNYNLFVNAPAAGCAVALAPTDASGTISGRVVTAKGQGIPKASLTVSGGGLGTPITLRTNSFGYYSFSDLPGGGVYIVTVSAKMFTFAEPTRAVNLEDNASDIDFVAEP